MAYVSSTYSKDLGKPLKKAILDNVTKFTVFKASLTELLIRRLKILTKFYRSFILLKYNVNLILKFTWEGPDAIKEHDCEEVEQFPLDNPSCSLRSTGTTPCHSPG